MKLETKRLILREYTPDDFEDLYEILSDAETMKHYTKPFDAEKVKNWIQRNIENYEIFGFGLWAVVLKESGKLIGDCGVTMQTINGKIKPEIGYHIHKNFQNRGYATEAARKCRDYIFENTTFNTIYSYMKYTNIGSYTVAMKNGMKLMEEYDDPVNTISKAYAITRQEWEQEINSEIIRVMKPTIEYGDDIMQFRKEIMEANDNDSFAGCGSLKPCVTVEEWLDVLDKMENVETCQKGGVTANTYIAIRISDNKVVGIIDLRHHIDHPILGLWGGHIGYTIRPSERKKGYAKEMLRQNLQNCKDRGLDKVMITCSRDNLASEKTIVANGGVFEKEVYIDGEFIKRYWITL